MAEMKIKAHKMTSCYKVDAMHSVNSTCGYNGHLAFQPQKLRSAECNMASMHGLASLGAFVVLFSLQAVSTSLQT